LNGAPFAGVSQVLAVPPPRATTRIPEYWQPLPRQDCTAIASLLPSGDNVTSSTERFPGTVIGSRVRLAARPCSVTRSRKNLARFCTPVWPISVMTNVRSSAAAVMLDPCAPPWLVSVGTCTVASAAPVTESCTAAAVLIRCPRAPAYRWKTVT
jgi:hypothetical protein